MPRFVILRHEPPIDGARPLHWDFMLESEGVLLTWALQSEPGHGRTIPASRLEDHRAAYLDYEGPVSRNRGSVSRFDAGEYLLIVDSDDRWEVALRGGRLCCDTTLQRDDRSRQRWSITFSSPGEDARC
jgi:hypothetical protein